MYRRNFCILIAGTLAVGIFSGCEPSRFDINDGVKFERTAPLHGVCIEDRSLSIIRDDLGFSVEIPLKGKKMSRESELGPWMLDAEELPESLRSYRDLIQEKTAVENG